jgi:anhydro-N-acetylmuramic acid kinase
MKILCSDIGPGNTLIDAWVRKHYSIAFDNEGIIAGSGIVNEALLAKFLEHKFFDLPFQKTTGPEEFNYGFVEESIRITGLKTISNEDVAATLTKLTALTIANAINTVLPNSAYKLYASGGGANNKTMMRMLKAELPDVEIRTTGEKGILPDAKEAALFAILANECVSGDPQTFSGTGLPNVRMGKVSFPD